MKRGSTYFDSNTEPLENRIASGLHKLGLASKHQTWRKASEEGLSPTQGQILAALSGDPRRATEVAALLGIGLPTVSESVRTLVEKGLVEKTKDPADARASLLGLTRDGKARAARATGWPELLATAVGAMSRAEQEVFFSGVVKMIRALQETEQIPVARMCVTCVHFRPDVHAGAKPHHCAFVDAPMAGSQLRLECDDHAPVDATQAPLATASHAEPPSAGDTMSRAHPCARTKAGVCPRGEASMTTSSTSSTIPGYTFGASTLPPSPISRAELDRMKQSVLFGDEDVRYLRLSHDVLEDQIEAILDVWYGFVGAHPHLLASFSDAQGNPQPAYLSAVRRRFGRWILDTARADYDERWLAYQHEIGLRHHRTKKNATDGATASAIVPFRDLFALVFPITFTLRDFLGKKGHGAQDVERMYAAWLKSCLLQVTLWSHPYVKPGDF